jgi:hypothetical protein
MIDISALISFASIVVPFRDQIAAEIPNEEAPFILPGHYCTVLFDSSRRDCSLQHYVVGQPTGPDRHGRPSFIVGSS